MQLKQRILHAMDVVILAIIAVNENSNLPLAMWQNWAYYTYWKTCLTRKQVKLEGVSYRRACLICRYILLEYMFYRMVCFEG